MAEEASHPTRNRSNGRGSQQPSDSWDKALKPNIVRGSWQPEEDQAISLWVQENGEKKWAGLAEKLTGRTGKQCRERSKNILDPNVRRDPWTEDEDQRLVALHNRYGNKWSDIGKELNRPDNCVKNRWNSTLKKQIERRNRGESEVQKRGRKPKCRT